MGVSASALSQLVKEEYLRLAKDRDYLTLDDVLVFRLGDTGLGIDPENIGVLFAIDMDRDGRFRLGELQKFARDWNTLGNSSQAYEIQSTVHAGCMMHFWRDIASEGGLQVAVDWLLALVTHNHSVVADLDTVDMETAVPSTLTDTPVAPTLSVLGGFGGEGGPLDDAPRTFQEHPGVLFIHQHSLFGLYRILGHQGATRNDMQPFFNTLQRLAEDRAQLELSNSSLDEWVPESVLRDYIVEVLQNCRQLVTDMEMLSNALQGPYLR